MKKPEILAPAGTKESVIAALNGGCDAIYIGGKSFGARAYADNPSDDELKEIIILCHLRGVKVFITINTLYKENEINDVVKFVSKIYSYGVYGVIVQDIGIADIIKKNFKGLKISASTQMTIHNADGVRLMNELGYDRVVIARELNENEIKKICSIKGDTEIEGFIHGALCVCYSGRCLMSSFIGGRSGNRGRCAQPCRMEYTLKKNGKNIKKGCLLSPKDISAMDIIKRVVNTGVDSLKIEGRMKSPQYVYLVTSLYRKYLDTLKKPDKEDIKNLTQIFNRGGSLSRGYFDTWSGSEMMSTVTPKSSGVEIGTVLYYNPKNKKCTIKLYDNITAGDGIEIWSNPHTGTGINKKAYKNETITLTVDGKIKKGDRVFKSFDKALNDSLKKNCEKITRKQIIKTEVYINEYDFSEIVFTDYNISVKGDKAVKAQNQPMTEEAIISKIKKTGETPFEFNIVKAEIGDNVYIPVSSLNNLRRKACNILEERLKNDLERENINVEYISQNINKALNAEFTVLVKTKEQFDAAVDGCVNIIYSDILKPELAEIAKNNNKKLYYCLPNISREGYDKYINILDKTGCEGYIVRSYGRIKTNKKIIADYTLNAMNRLSINKLRNIYNCERVCISPELNIKELRDIADNKSEIVVYGRLPLMTTHQCPAGIYDGKKGAEKYCKIKNSYDSYAITDRKNMEFPIIRDCENCIAYILNSAPLHTLDKFNDIKNTGAGFYRIELTNEDYDLSLKIINSYALGKPFEIKNSTRGHYYRGVQ